uniref:Uncharacterized protein n=1 Tax=Timema shepardi TaxID=629360 RepID=A0A7R9B8E4_TIMSH|nr:unnamed protein product [Timema shepardi]
MIRKNMCLAAITSDSQNLGYQSVPVMRRSTAPSLRKFVSLPDGSTEYVPRFNAPFVPHASRDTASILELVLDPAPEACFVDTKFTWDTPTSACQDVSSTGTKDTPTSACQDVSGTGRKDTPTSARQDVSGTGRKDTPTSVFPDSSITSAPDNFGTSTRTMDWPRLAGHLTGEIAGSFAFESFYPGSPSSPGGMLPDCWIPAYNTRHLLTPMGSCYYGLLDPSLQPSPPPDTHGILLLRTVGSQLTTLATS